MVYVSARVAPIDDTVVKLTIGQRERHRCSPVPLLRSFFDFYRENVNYLKDHEEMARSLGRSLTDAPPDRSASMRLGAIVARLFHTAGVEIDCTDTVDKPKAILMQRRFDNVVYTDGSNDNRRQGCTHVSGAAAVKVKVKSGPQAEADARDDESVNEVAEFFRLYRKEPKVE